LVCTFNAWVTCYYTAEIISDGNFVTITFV
jgi:hypothetical protein